MVRAFVSNTGKRPFWFWHLSNVGRRRGAGAGAGLAGSEGGSRPGRRVLIAAIDLALSAELERALEIVRAHESDPIACRIQAIVHRMRGDKVTAMAWYRRAGQMEWPNTDPQGQLLHLRQELDFQY